MTHTNAKERERASDEAARDRHAARSKVMGEREYAWRICRGRG